METDIQEPPAAPLLDYATPQTPAASTEPQSSAVDVVSAGTDMIFNVGVELAFNCVTGLFDGV
ncbi:MAG TPA: hypothetical protein VF624_03570 [Tepidisphaeraceae bacterium]|jgi:hypothetical protein